MWNWDNIQCFLDLDSLFLNGITILRINHKLHIKPLECTSLIVLNQLQENICKDCAMIWNILAVCQIICFPFLLLNLKIVIKICLKLVLIHKYSWANRILSNMIFQLFLQPQYIIFYFILIHFASFSSGSFLKMITIKRYWFWCYISIFFLLFLELNDYN